MSVQLRPLTQENFHDAFFLEITDEERSQSQLGTMEDIIEELISNKERTGIVIYSGEVAVGFADYGFVPSKSAYQVYDFLIDKNHRGHGYGETALRLLIAELCGKPDCQRIGLSYMSFNNSGAIELFEKVGFVELPNDGSHGSRFAMLPCG